MSAELKQREQELEARALRINAGRKPKFGDLMRNPWAGESNPRRDAYFVRRVGDHYEFTDKRGDFWQTRAKFAFFIGATQPAPCTAEEVLRKKKQMVIDGDFLYDFDLERIRSAQAAIATQPAPIPVQANCPNGCPKDTPYGPAICGKCMEAAEASATIKAGGQGGEDGEKYRELIFAVGHKFPSESRHETALRYIREAEATKSDGRTTHTKANDGDKS